MFAVDGGISLFKVLGTMDTMGTMDTNRTSVVFLYVRTWGTMDIMGTMDTMGTMGTSGTRVVFLYFRCWGTMDTMGTNVTSVVFLYVDCLYPYFYIFYRPL